MSDMFTIPVYEPFLSEDERNLLINAFDSTWISSNGKYLDQFEDEFSQFCGVDHTIAVANGTVALHLALLALGIGPGDEVIVPSFTYIASVNCIKYVGATPVFVDVDPETWAISAGDVRAKLTKRTKCVICVHLYGVPADIVDIKNLCDSAGIFLVEDCAEAIGARVKGRHVGTFGQISTYSFFGNKTITTGEGGAVVTSDQILAEKIKLLKGQGQSPNRRYFHEVIGYNYRMTNLAAAIGLGQLRKVDKILANKRIIFDQYQAVVDLFGLKTQAVRSGDTHGRWLFTFLANSASEREHLRRYLLEANIETRPVFLQAHRMPMYNDASHLKVSSNLSACGLSLPSHPGLNETDLMYICEKLEQFYK